MEGDPDVILHIIVVGFHHKKGYQVEFSHPPWPTGMECPPEWSHLPSIAMPDGSHNYHQETVYFHLPPLEGSNTVYGVSCYRQIDADRVVNRTEDITRHSVQKSVVALSRLPLYGQIQVKLDLITTAYFETGDFSRVEVLKEAFNNLNQCLNPSILRTPQVFVGLSVRDLVLSFRHKLLVLFKLALLERRVLLFHSPVSELCAGLLALVSLLPETLQGGLSRAALQPRPPSRRSSARRSASDPASDALPTAAVAPMTASSDAQPSDATAGTGSVRTGNSTFYHSGEQAVSPPAACSQSTFYRSVSAPEQSGDLPVLHRTSSSGSPRKGSVTGGSTFYSLAGDQGPEGRTAAGADSRKSRGNSVFYASTEEGVASNGDYSAETGSLEEGETPDHQSFDGRLERLLAASQRLNDHQCGMPLQLFRKGHLCHPYLSLSDIHLLSDSEVHTLLAGATNVLYSHKRHLVDAYVTMAPCLIELQSAELRRQLTLSTEDLRLADILVRAVTEPGCASSSSMPELHSSGGDASDAPARGSEAWLRAVFRLYLYMMLRTSLLPDGSAELSPYNSCYMAALRETVSYQRWAEGQHLGVLEVNPGHPCSGQLSMADMRLRISQTLQGSERGRRVTQAVATTGRAVGGALSVARGALSSWWSSLATPEEPPVDAAVDATPDSDGDGETSGETTSAEEKPAKAAADAAGTEGSSCGREMASAAFATKHTVNA